MEKLRQGKHGCAANMVKIHHAQEIVNNVADDQRDNNRHNAAREKLFPERYSDNRLRHSPVEQRDIFEPRQARRSFQFSKR